MTLGYDGALTGAPEYALLVVIGMVLWVLFVVGLFEWASRRGAPHPHAPQDQPSSGDHTPPSGAAASTAHPDERVGGGAERKPR